MDRRVSPFFCVLFLTFGLSACSSIGAKDQRETICKELKSRMTFNGSTINNRNAEIADSEDELLQRQYEKYHCDEI